MTYGKTSRQYLRDVERCREKVEQWEKARFGILSLIGLCTSLILVGIAFTVVGLASSDAQVALFVPGGVGVFLATGLYFLVRWLHWSTPGGYGRNGTDGPYEELRDAEAAYEDALDREAAKTS